MRVESECTRLNEFIGGIDWRIDETDVRLMRHPSTSTGRHHGVHKCMCKYIN